MITTILFLGLLFAIGYLCVKIIIVLVQIVFGLIAFLLGL